ARALVVTAAEEFGIAAVEALASGRPVIALRSGGVLESVEEGVTGAYYEADDPAALASTVAAFDPLKIDPAACVAAARRFAKRDRPPNLGRRCAYSVAVGQDLLAAPGLRARRSGSDPSTVGRRLRGSGPAHLVAGTTNLTYNSYQRSWY